MRFSPLNFSNFLLCFRFLIFLFRFPAFQYFSVSLLWQRLRAVLPGGFPARVRTAAHRAKPKDLHCPLRGETGRLKIFAIRTRCFFRIQNTSFLSRPFIPAANQKKFRRTGVFGIFPRLDSAMRILCFPKEHTSARFQPQKQSAFPPRCRKKRGETAEKNHTDPEKGQKIPENPHCCRVSGNLFWWTL